MKHSLTDIVDVILRRLQEHPGPVPSEKGLRTWLPFGREKGTGAGQP